MTNSVASSPLNDLGFRSALRRSYREADVVESISGITLELTSAIIEPYANSVQLSYHARAPPSVYEDPIAVLRNLGLSYEDFDVVANPIQNIGTSNEEKSFEICRKDEPDYSTYIVFSRS